MKSTGRLGLFAIAIAIAVASANALAANPLSKPRHKLVIVHTAALESAAREWADYRESAPGGAWGVVLHSAGDDRDQQARREAIQQFIQNEYRESSPHLENDFAVLLLGDTESDSQSADNIPAWYVEQTDPMMLSDDPAFKQFATDNNYQLMDDADDVPDFALGRVSARSVDEARTMLAKIKRYESSPTLAQLATGERARINYVAGEGHFGVMDDLLEMLFKAMVDRMVPQAYDINMTYAKASSIYCPPPSKLSETVYDQLNSGALLFNYIGHGYAKGFDSLRWGNKRIPILNVAALENFDSHFAASRSAQAASAAPAAANSSDHLLPIAFLACCSTGWFDLPHGDHSMAEEMLFSPRGAIAVIAGSRITHPYANTILQKNITKSLLTDHAATIGELDLQATRNLLKRDGTDRELDMIANPIARNGKWQTSLADLRRMHVKLYNLLGDPATRIPQPNAEIKNLKFENGIISGEVPGMKEGKVYITLETPRTSFAEPEKIQQPIGDNDPELEAKAARNFSLAMTRVLARIQCSVANESFAVTCGGIAENAQGMRAVAIGIDQSGQTLGAIGSFPIRTAAQSESQMQTDRQNAAPQTPRLSHTSLQN